MNNLTQLSTMVLKDDQNEIKNLTKALLSSGVSIKDVVNEGFMRGINMVASKYKSKEIFLPQLIAAAKTLSAGLEAVEEAAAPELELIEEIELPTLRKRHVLKDSDKLFKNVVNLMAERAGLCKCATKNLVPAGH